MACYSVPNVLLTYYVIHVALQGPYKLKALKYPIQRIESRGTGFSELKCHWTLPIHETTHVTAICTGPGKYYVICSGTFVTQGHPLTTNISFVL